MSAHIFPSVCRRVLLAVLRLKWFTAGYITTVIRDRRIYNFLSLNTSLRIIFLWLRCYNCVSWIRLFNWILCRLCCVCLLSLWPDGCHDINQACVEMFQDPPTVWVQERDCGASMPCTRALSGTEECHRKENGVKHFHLFAAEWRVKETKTTLGGLWKHKQAGWTANTHVIHVHYTHWFTTVARKANNK